MLLFLFEREQLPPKKNILPLFFFIIFELFIGLFLYHDLYLKEPAKLAALLSGACIIFLSFKKRSRFAYISTFFLYFIISLGIGLASSPRVLDYQIPFGGILVFSCAHLVLVIGFFLFKGDLPEPLVPFFFGALFFMLPYFPELEWLEPWMEGIDLLLFLLGLLRYEVRKNSEQTITDR